MKGIWPFLWLMSGAWLFLTGYYERRMLMASIGLVTLIVIGATLIPRPISTNVDLRYVPATTTTVRAVLHD